MPSISLHIISCKICSERCGRLTGPPFPPHTSVFTPLMSVPILFFIYHCLSCVCKFHVWAHYISLFCNLQLILYPTRVKRYASVFIANTCIYKEQFSINISFLVHNFCDDYVKPMLICIECMYLSIKQFG